MVRSPSTTAEWKATPRGRGGGAAIGATRGRLLLRNVRAEDGQDVVFTGVAQAAGGGVQLRAPLSVRDGVNVALKGEVVNHVSLRRTNTRRPELVLEDVQTGTVENHPTDPGRVVVRP